MAEPDTKAAENKGSVQTQKTAARKAYRRLMQQVKGVRVFGTELMPREEEARRQWLFVSGYLAGQGKETK
jgi:hypothetical protein